MIIILYPFILMLWIMSCIGTIFEKIVCFWMEEPITFWSDLRKELWEILKHPIED